MPHRMWLAVWVSFYTYVSVFVCQLNWEQSSESHKDLWPARVSPSCPSWAVYVRACLPPGANNSTEFARSGAHMYLQLTNTAHNLLGAPQTAIRNPQPASSATASDPVPLQQHELRPRQQQHRQQQRLADSNSCSWGPKKGRPGGYG